MDDSQLQRAARAVLDQNWTGSFTKPAPSLCPHQWNWEAGFIALGNAYQHFDRSVSELRHLFSAQWSHGMVPQIVFGPDREARYFPGPAFWQAERSPLSPAGIRTSGITMPPVHGFVLWQLYQAATDKTQATAFLEEMYPKVLAFHRYLYTYRDPREEGLVYIRHPWEGGTDNSPLYDQALARIEPSPGSLPPYERKDLQNPKAAAQRPTQWDYDRHVYLAELFRRYDYDDAAIYETCPFLIQDPLFNGILSWSTEALISIGSHIGADIAEPLQWHELTIWSMNDKLWNEEAGIYGAYDLREEALVSVKTASGLMPLCGEVPTQEQAETLLRTLESAAFGGTGAETWLCPTYDLEAPDINYQKYCRGPVWINLNWLLYKGLLRYDMKQMADKVRQHSLELLAQNGLHEYFDPRREAEDAGCGTGQFSSSAALAIDLLQIQA